MQKLIYQNLRGENVAFFHAPFVLCKVRGVGMNDVKITASSGAYQQGESLVSLRREARKVKVTLHLMAASREEMYRLRSQLLSALSPDKAFDGENRARLIYENDYGRRWTWATPESGLDWGDRKQNAHPSLSLTFRCESPYWYSVGKSEAVFRARENGFTLPRALPLRLGSKVFQQILRNGGQSDAPVWIGVEGKGESPTLINDSTGALLRLISPLPAGDVLEVNTDPAALAVRVRHPDGSEENGFGLLDPTSSVAAFCLRPGENELRYVPEGDGSETAIRISWYELYEGV